MNLNKSILVCVLLSFSCVPQLVQGQVKYTPDHPEVKAMADAAVGFLKSRRTGMSREYRALAALAIVEHGKRYSGRVPKSDSIVKAACENIAANIDGITNENEMYFPSLATILLAETDARAYKDEIKQLLAFIQSRQEVNGSFTYVNDNNATSDTSQTQFAATCNVRSQASWLQCGREDGQRDFGMDFGCWFTQSRGLVLQIQHRWLSFSGTANCKVVA